MSKWLVALIAAIPMDTLHSRRSALRLLAAAAAGSCVGPAVLEPAPSLPPAPLPLRDPLPEPPRSRAFLPEPDFAPERVLRTVAGIRPYRVGSFRLESERIAGRTVVHNYGHGGGGLSVSWGCAEEAADLVQRELRAPQEVGVLGAGVLGLSTAAVLVARGFAPVIYAAQFSPETTSDVAGGQWTPSLISVGSSQDERARYRRILRTSIDHFRSKRGREYGVSVRDNYVAGNYHPSLLSIPEDILPPARALERLPFEHADTPGQVRETLLIEPPIYLRRLDDDLRSAGVPFLKRRFAAIEEVAELREQVFVNCLGPGAGPVCRDSKAVPMRGQLVLLEPQQLPWLLSHRGGYVFPRSDAVVLGGTAERGVDRAVTDPADCTRILESNARFFRS